MKSCNGCIFADWQTTAIGRLHPSGEGRCRKIISLPQLPQAFYYPGSAASMQPLGGYINRREEHKDHCVYYNTDPKHYSIANKPENLND